MLSPGQLDPESGEPVKEVVPLRISGPGRKERAYRTRIDELESSLSAADLIERGGRRYVDRMEEQLTVQTARERRLVLALGAVQREVELLRSASVTPALEAPRGFWSRLLGRP